MSEDTVRIRGDASSQYRGMEARVTRAQARRAGRYGSKATYDLRLELIGGSDIGWFHESELELVSPVPVGLPDTPKGGET